MLATSTQVLSCLGKSTPETGDSGSKQVGRASPAAHPQGLIDADVRLLEAVLVQSLASRTFFPGPPALAYTQPSGE